jgi:hypothetical protein
MRRLRTRTPQRRLLTRPRLLPRCTTTIIGITTTIITITTLPLRRRLTPPTRTRRSNFERD